MKQLRLLLGINVFWLALSLLGEGLTTIILPTLLLNIVAGSVKATILGGLTFVGLLAGMLIQPVAGLVSDQHKPRFGRRPLLIIGTVGIIISLALLGLSQTLLAIFVVYILVQIAASVAQAAQQGWLPDLVPAALRGRAAGIKGLMDLGGALLAFALLGQLLSHGQLTPALVLMVVVVIAAFGLMWILVREPRSQTNGAARPPSSRPGLLASVYRFDLRQNAEFAWLIGARVLFLLGTYAVGRFFLFYVADRLSLGPGQAAAQAGALLAALTLITALSAPLGGWAADRLGRVPLMWIGAALSGLGTLMLVFAGNAGAILAFGSLMALGSAAFSSANWAQTADLAPPAEAARFFALANFGTTGAVAVAGLLGPLVDVWFSVPL